MHKDVIDSLIGWIDEHIDKPLKISDVAEKSGYSKWHLQRMFQQVIGETLGELYSRQKTRISGE
ncbi:Regulatory protein soxS [Campylobacter jejuni]|nr:Regulatory protein soxS [Campylobacter jejuni]